MTASLPHYRNTGISIIIFLFLLFVSRGEAAQVTNPSNSPQIMRKSTSGLLASSINRVSPIYPPLAKSANVGGSVVVEVVIDEQGNVISSRAISGHPLLKEAAVAASRDWKFAPTVINGMSVKVRGNITFNFTPDSGTSALQIEESDTERERALKDAEIRGVERGRNEGYQQGFKEGEAKGYEAGHDAGLQAKEAEQKANSFMEKVREWLAWVFGYIFYPIIVIGIFIYILIMIGVIIMDGQGAGRVRRSVGAVLPLLVLVFLIVTGQDKDNPIGTLFGSLTPFWRFITGAATGLILMEAGKLLLDIDNEISSSLYAMFLSGLGAFLIWSIMGGALPVINLSLFGLVIAGCMHVIFEGHRTFSIIRDRRPTNACTGAAQASLVCYIQCFLVCYIQCFVRGPVMRVVRPPCGIRVLLEIDKGEQL